MSFRIYRLRLWLFLQGLWCENPSFSCHFLCMVVPALSVVLSKHINSASSRLAYTFVLYIPLFTSFIHNWSASSFHLFCSKSWHIFLLQHLNLFNHPMIIIISITFFVGMIIINLRIPTHPKSTVLFATLNIKFGGLFSSLTSS